MKLIVELPPILILILTVFSGADNRVMIFIPCMVYWIAVVILDTIKNQKKQFEGEELQKIKNELQLIKTQMAFKSTTRA